MSNTQYGIGVTKNRFELADIYDEDPIELLKIREQELEARKKTKLSEKENKGKEPVTVKTKAPVRKGIKETQNLKSEGQRGLKEDKVRAPRIERTGTERKSIPEIRDDLRNRRNRDDRQDFHREERAGTDKFERKVEFRGERNSFYVEGGNPEGRGRGRGGRGGFAARGTRGGRGGSRPSFDYRGKREYDRQSGSDKTGVKQVDKKDGSGAHNWGNHRDELEDLNNPISPIDDGQNWSPEKPDGDNAPDLNGTVEGEEVATTPQEEDKKELTLDEWKALKGPRQKPTFNLRKAGEGEDLTQWKKMYALQKRKEDGEEDDDEYEYESSENPRVGRQKQVLDIEIHFKDMRGRGRGNRGTGRGGPRGMRGNSNNASFSDKHSNTGRDSIPKAAPKVDDEHDFPSLG